MNWVYYDKIPICSIVYLLEGECKSLSTIQVWALKSTTRPLLTLNPNVEAKHCKQWNMNFNREGQYRCRNNANVMVLSHPLNFGRADFK